MSSKGFTGREAGQRLLPGKVQHISNFGMHSCKPSWAPESLCTSKNDDRAGEGWDVSLIPIVCECSHCVPVELGEGGMASAFACLSLEMCSE